MAENIDEKTNEGQHTEQEEAVVSPQVAETTAALQSTVEPGPIAPKAKKGGKNLLWIALAAILVIALGLGGGFGYLRYSEQQALNQAHAALSTGKWADAQAAAEKGLALQPANLMANPLALKQARAEALFRQRRYEQANTALVEIEMALPNDATPYLYHALMYFEQGKLDEAVKAGDQVLRRDQKMGFPYALRAYQALQQNKLSDALTAANIAIQNDPQTELAYRVRAAVALAALDGESALADLNKALELSPNQHEVLAYRAYAHSLRLEEEETRADAAAVIKAAPESAEGYWAKALIARLDFDDDAEIEAMNKAIELAPNRADFYAMRGESYYKAEQEKLALADYEKALQLNPDFAPAIANKAVFLFMRYRSVDIAAEVERVNKAAPKSGMGPMLLAMQAMRERDFKKALEQAEKAIAAQPGPFSGYIMRGDIYETQHELEKAAADFRKLIEINPRTLTGRLRLVEVLTNQKKYDEAEKILEEAAKLDPDSIYVNTNRASIFLAREKPEKASAPLEEAFKRDPNNPTALMTRAYFHMAQNNNLAALADVNKIGELYPEDPGVMMLRAVIYNANNDPKNALAEAAKAEKINKNIDGLHSIRATAYMLQGDLNKATASGKKAVEQEPWDTSVQILTGDAFMKQGNYADAITYAKKAVDIDPELRYGYYVLGMSQWFSGDLEAAIPNLEKMVRMKGKLDMELIDQAEQAWNFLKSVPKLENSLRTVKDEEKHYTLAYTNDWIPQPVEAGAGAMGMEFRLKPRDYQGDAVIQVQVIMAPDDVPTGYMTPSILADNVRNVVTKLSDTVVYEDRAFMTVNGNAGVVDTFQITYQSEATGSNIPARMRIYYFIFGRSLVSIHYLAGLADFDKVLPKVEEVINTLNALP